jgi:hypothetical protein
MNRSRRIPLEANVAAQSVRPWQDPEVSDALEQWMASILKERGLDPVTDEAVRLRCAYHHDCHT